MAGFAADPIRLDETHGYMSARLILVDAMELAWQRAKYRGNQHQLLSADPGLVEPQHAAALALATASSPG